MLKRENLDTMPVNDVDKRFFWGHLKLTEIQVNGIASLFRCGDFELTYEHDTEQLRVEFHLGFDELGFGCSYRTTVLGIGPHGQITGKVKNLEMELSLIIDLDLLEATVQKYKITKSGHIKIDLHGHPLTDWWNDIIINSATTIFKGIIEHTVDNMVTQFLTSLVDEIDSILEIILGGD
ncbi:hypothetical protein HHI36_010254 [Cryptolaemus montrouzieri]|uniref:Uncharacterized protein n=1 Tax=Cryptolaemus montrouzieri TaxID=559131 RepID=A0ABD2MIN0_9CUCU